MSKQSYPLCWPGGWKRTESVHRKQAQFYTRGCRVTIAQGVQRVMAELRRMGIPLHECIVSTNVEPKLDGMPRSGKEPADPGAAVYWMDGNQQRCMAIDRYSSVADNLAAIAATLEAMRAIERHGGAEILNRAFLGFAALPEQASGSWRYHLGFGEHQVVTADNIKSAYRDLAHKHHQDKGGDAELFRQITQARDAALQEVGATL